MEALIAAGPARPARSEVFMRFLTTLFFVSNGHGVYLTTDKDS